MADALRANPLSKSMPVFGKNESSTAVDLAKLKTLASSWRAANAPSESEGSETKTRSGETESQGTAPESRRAGVCLVVACSLTHAADRMDLPDPLVEL